MFVVVLSISLVLVFAAVAQGAIWNFEKSYMMRDRRAVPQFGRVYPRAYQNGTAGRGYDYNQGSGTRNSVIAPQASVLTSNEGSATFVYLQWWAVDPDNPRNDSIMGGNIYDAPRGDERYPLVAPTANSDAVSGGSPHGGYLIGTVKCAVCHSVHTAAPAQSAVTPVADTLLRTKAADACALCHVAAGNTVMDPVYGGVYPIPNEAGHALGNPMCTECHTGPHGAMAETEVASLKGKLLTLATDYGATEGVWEGNPGPLPWSTVLTRVAAIEASAAAQGFAPKVTGYTVAEYRTLVTESIKNQAVGIFCGGCHEGSYANTIAGASASNKMGWQVGEFTGHRTMAAATDTWNSVDATKSSSAHRGIKIADAPANSCYSCHDAYSGFGTSLAFPHNWGTANDEALVYNATLNEFENQTFAWLLRASNASRSDETTSGGIGGKSAHVGASGGTLADGVCLKCHRWTAGSVSSGVGLTY